jgi:hypothetical protein
MTDGLLNNIIQLEKNIQAEAANEVARVSAWQTRELANLQTALATARSDEEQRCQRLMAEHKTALLREGANLEAAATAWCERLTGLDDTTLHTALKRQLAAILPGGDHDHPHGQG